MLCVGWAGNAYPSGHLVPSLFLGGGGGACMCSSWLLRPVYPTLRRFNDRTELDFHWIERFPWNIGDGFGMPAGSAYSSGHLVPFLFLGLACAPIVETRFLEIALSLLYFSPWIPLKVFSRFRLDMKCACCGYLETVDFMPRIEWSRHNIVFSICLFVGVSVFICCCFLCPGSNDLGHIVFVLSICLFICLSVVNFNIRYNFWAVGDRYFLYCMHTQQMMPFLMTTRSTMSRRFTIYSAFLDIKIRFLDIKK